MKKYFIILFYLLTLPCLAFSQNWQFIGANNGLVGNSNSSIPVIVTDTAGIPYIVYSADSFRITIKKWADTGWLSISNPNDTFFGFNPSIKISKKTNEIYIGFQSLLFNMPHPRVIKYDGNTWKQLGSPLPTIVGNIQPDGFTALAIDRKDSLYFVFGDRTGLNYFSETASVWKFDGNDWGQLGNPYSLKRSNFVDLAVDTNNVLYLVNNKGYPAYHWCYVQRWADTGWQVIATADTFSSSPMGVAGNTHLVVDEKTNKLYLSYGEDGISGFGSVKCYDGNKWTQVGNAGFTNYQARIGSIILDSMGHPLISFNGAGLAPHVMKYNGNSWQNEGVMLNTNLCEGWPNIAYGKNGVLFLTGYRDTMANVMYLGNLTGVDEVKAECIVTVYPNPANEQLNIQTQQAGSLVLTDITGRVILQASTPLSYQKAIDISMLAKGVYLLRFSSNDGAVETVKVVKE